MPGLHSRLKQTEEEEVVEEIKAEEQIFNKEDVQLFPQGRHVWRQQGPYLVCKECSLYHATYIGMDKVMLGEDEDGKPILQRREEISV